MEFLPIWINLFFGLELLDISLLCCIQETFGRTYTWVIFCPGKQDKGSLFMETQRDNLSFKIIKVISARFVFIAHINFCVNNYFVM